MCRRIAFSPLLYAKTAPKGELQDRPKNRGVTAHSSLDVAPTTDGTVEYLDADAMSGGCRLFPCRVADPRHPVSSTRMMAVAPRSRATMDGIGPLRPPSMYRRPSMTTGRAIRGSAMLACSACRRGPRLKARTSPDS